METRLTLAHGPIQAIDALAAVLAWVICAVWTQLTPDRRLKRANMSVRNLSRTTLDSLSTVIGWFMNAVEIWEIEERFESDLQSHHLSQFPIQFLIK